MNAQIIGPVPSSIGVAHQSGGGESSAMAAKISGIGASFRALILLAITFFLICEPSMAADDPINVGAKLAELKSATEITLLIVSYPSEFYRHVDKVELQKVSCIYRVASDRGPTFDKVFDIIRNADVQDDWPPRGDLRVGIIFKRSGEVLSELYSDDWDGEFKVHGSWDDRPIVASADLPGQLRTILTRPDVALLKTASNHPCPHT